MTARSVLAGAALVAAWSGPEGGPVPQRGGLVTIHAVVERAQPVMGPLRVVPWRLVRDLTARDFEIITDAGAPAVESGSIENSPVAMVALVDVGASAQIPVDWLLEPLRKALVPALQPGDRLSFGRFGGTGLRLDGVFTADRRELQDAAHTLMAHRDREAPPRQTASSAGAAPGAQAVVPVRPDSVTLVRGLNGAFGLGASAVWDAVDAAITSVAAQPGRRAVIVITDGRSSGNVHGLNEVIFRAVAADVPVFFVGEAQEEAIRQGEAGWAIVRPAAFLQSMAQLTGGAYADVFGPEKGRPRSSNQGEVERWIGRVLVRFVEDLHHTYALSFVPAVTDGQMHRLEVRVKVADLTVRARHGYVAPTP